jgi:sugar phosphate isomerase/epimerase
VDSWHHFRGAADDSMLRALPAERIVVVQLSDGPAEPSQPDFFTETTTSRRLLGDGDWDVRAFVELLRATGSDAPLSLELLSDELKSGPADVAARRLAATTSTTLGVTIGGAR